MAEVNAEWARVANTTLVQYAQKVENNVLRKRVLTDMLRDKGRFSFNNKGRELEVRVQKRRVAMTAYGDMDVINYARQDRWQRANLDWRGYIIADAYSEKERLMNRGEEAIIDVTKIGQRLLDDIGDQWPEEFYVDGNAAGNENQFHGIQSFTGQTATGALAGYRVPDDSYAQIDTDPGAYGGTWTGTWPDGTGDALYDFWSPIIIDYTHASAWSEGSTWASNCVQVLRAATLRTQRRGGKDGQLDFFMMDLPRYQQLLDKIGAKERIQVGRGETSKLVQLGFRDVVNIDGVDATWEYGCPDTQVYGFNCDKMQVKLLYDQIFKVHGPFFNENDLSWRVAVACFGNIWWSPAHFCQLDNYS